MQKETNPSADLVSWAPCLCSSALPESPAPLLPAHVWHFREQNGNVLPGKQHKELLCKVAALDTLFLQLI